ncbi:phosphate acetyltransferase [Syntrophotalea carbinolica DSM 2380]|uniref:Phosphate acetyltransferase n=1 Tax=Syntrophotalea carbinolica (strain DSM 2380 / NBRC 103641 / GraBd1) TaxID=338963 RepID=Q3A0M2_SYNC1|nr:phosphate acetyltransferase [Syntrophotalea carbinolica]ABA90085.1 phosphate acetyltransferase [Syntrophotalea carbinolica DSM 2380]
MDVISQIKQKARGCMQTIVLPESYDDRMLLAADQATREGLARIVLLGDPESVASRAASVGADLNGVELVAPAASSCLRDYVEQLVELRRHKGLTEDAACKQLLALDNLFFAAMMVRKGDADGAVAGAFNSTGDVLRAALQVVGTAEGIRTVSSVMLMVTTNPDLGVNGTLLFADCVVNPRPDARALAEIAVTTARSCRSLLGVEARVAMLSFSTQGSADHEEVDKVRQAVEIARSLAPDELIDGEMQLDAAIAPSVAGKKAPDSLVAGHANTLVFPDLNAGNIGYKLTERIAGARAAGLMVQGLARPVNDMSRGCTVEDIVSTVAMTAVQACG